MIDCTTETPGAFPQILRVRAHTFRADLAVSDGGTDSAPGPHDYFDAALAACNALTAAWYARNHNIPLERVETHVESDNREERKGIYLLKVRVAFHGPLTEEQRASLHGAVERCPIHKLMTTADVRIDTAPL